jgi:hypothetical protein
LPTTCRFEERPLPAANPPSRLKAAQTASLFE